MAGDKLDAIIVGGSFAGLATASRLQGNVLLLEQREIGSWRVSACAIPLKVPQQMGCLDSVLQVYHKGFIHAPSTVVEYDLSVPFCTFDYQKFCQDLVQRLDVKIIKARAIGLEGNTLFTDGGSFKARCIVDASGWRAVVASAKRPGFVDRGRLSFGLETLPRYCDEGIHFWTYPRYQGYGWVFPCGDHSRVGMVSYLGDTKLRDKLNALVKGLGYGLRELRGGFFPWGLRPPIVDNIFLVGDAAGQCLPLTGEGIRPALHFGQKLGDIIQDTIKKEIDLEEGLLRYRKLVMAYQPYYRFLEFLQRYLLLIPYPWLSYLMTVLSWKPLCRRLVNFYVRSSAPGR